MTPEEFKKNLKKHGIVLSDKQMNQFELYFKRLVEWNEKINLTAIVDKKEVYLKHFYDSLTLAFERDMTKEEVTLCDVGSGAGFPSIPLKIVFPNITISIVDSLNKRIKFLTELTTELGLDNVNLYHSRAEDFGQNKLYRESFDLVTARAVARLNVLAELCLPLVKQDGQFLAMKAAKSEEELLEAKKAIATLGGKVVSEHEVSLPITQDERFIIEIDKKKVTPNKYPRKAGLPNKKPLV
ncbi:MULTISPECIES: 16S rRNA (guanine(527)-N(7))-methyltransferase RsmG [Enterococcaceae]|uniref:16S rRNA (guanine(527)-N(7))-methyltransferase RsmG n=1 Tax=Enterococcaceae TaxID=81852 RepID=UPI000E5390E4|nr:MULTISPECIES: 16S rRNA (guanine(527)-N(7))-methyltransferase RsmG [Enterococcaceae]MCI0131335.1 16S rRNA (guanine(527)-N(7))-methyltransferase RsmG [Vagococcus sp. CY53-2]RGI29030.1 16S rRNA (guanine(527)-N(7))-methyltransferase RsmG [Melissococcus sp. OM08-11BH]UNM89531.1 16S rRNA (guanine(527)-N(7))-methyltransferase RsmG [Vagococcus sp. CY52-2]